MRQTNKLKFSLVAYGGYGGIFVENHNHVNFTEWHLRYSSKRQTGKSPSTGRWTLTGGDAAQTTVASGRQGHRPQSLSPHKAGEEKENPNNEVYL